ncbi:MAG: hypothetical protein J6T22_11115 [Bacteroidales bacterium]|nr:hypothetical protein [Bacteroidales bacterium]
MKIYKWLRGLMKASALTTVMFIMQACYGVPNAYEVRMSGVVVDKTTGLPLKGIEYIIDGHTWGCTDENGQFDIWRYYEIDSCHQLSFIDTVGRYQTFDTVIRDYDNMDLKIKLESNQ